jgi:hypothetical protein
MPFMLRDVGLECFTLVFRGEDVGSIFSTDDGHSEPWIAALHGDHAHLKAARPAPFKGDSHRFASLHELLDWLGVSAPAGDAAEAMV